MTPRRANEEQQPLLPSSCTRTPKARPWWAFWGRPRAGALGHVRFVERSDDEEEEDNLTATHRKKGRMTKCKHASIYVIVLLVGAVLGGWLSRALEGRKDGPSDGPMVPPVYTLPPPTGLPRNPAYLINATTAAVASEDVTCSNLGLSILRDRNGTAVDAAITTNLCIGLLNAFSSGIGGGGFMVVRVPQEGGSDITAIDFRETSPKKSEKEMYGSKKAGRAAAQVGGLAVGVPGELRGFEAAHKLYGHLPWEELVMPVAELAKGCGFMLDNPTWAAVYAPRGYLLVEGDYVQRLAYGKTLETIAKRGPAAFYEGDIAESMVKVVQSQGGILSLDDLKGYSARSYPAIHQTWNGKTIYTTSAPSSGGVMMGLFNLLEPLDLPSTGGLDNSSNVHFLIEAMKFAFGARSEVTDPAFASNLTRLDEFYSKPWADGIRPKIDNVTHDIEYYGLHHDTPVDHGTTHLSVVDQWGGAASVTSTINLIWGSHVMDPKTGVIFNDEQDDFAIPGAADAFGLLPSPWNYPAPGKKALSSTAATIVENPNGSLYAVLGGSGGSRIFPSIAQVLINLASGLDISAAIEKPRYHNQVVPPVTTVEVGPEGEDFEITAELRRKGHKIGVFDINVGVAEVQAIVLENGTIWASSDSRKNGVAAGY